MTEPKFVDVVDSLSGATLSVPEDQVERFAASGFRRPAARKAPPKKTTGGKSDDTAATADRDR